MTNFNNSNNIYQPVTDSRKPVRKSRLAVIINILLLVALCLLGYGYYLKQKELKLLSDPTAQTEAFRKEVEDIVTKAGKIVLLPEGDFPEVLMITDAGVAIKQQPSLTGVINGDKILVYTKSSKAVIYSPSRGVIVNIVPIFFQQENNGVEENVPAVEEEDNKKKN